VALLLRLSLACPTLRPRSPASTSRRAFALPAPWLGDDADDEHISSEGTLEGKNEVRAENVRRWKNDW